MWFEELPPHPKGTVAELKGFLEEHRAKQENPIAESDPEPQGGPLTQRVRDAIQSRFKRLRGAQDSLHSLAWNPGTNGKGVLVHDPSTGVTSVHTWPVDAQYRPNHGDYTDGLYNAGLVNEQHGYGPYIYINPDGAMHSYHGDISPFTQADPRLYGRGRVAPTGPIDLSVLDGVDF